MKEDPCDPTVLNRYEAPPALENLPPEVVERIRDAVDLLPEQEKAVVELLIWGTETKVEVAARLGVSRSHVHRLWLRAQEVLVEALADLHR